MIQCGPFGRVTKTTLDDGVYTRTDYDSVVRKAWEEDPLGHRIDYADDDAASLRWTATADNLASSCDLVIEAGDVNGLSTQVRRAIQVNPASGRPTGAITASRPAGSSEAPIPCGPDDVVSVSSRTEIFGSTSDDVQVAGYQLMVTPADGGEAITLATGTGSISNGLLGTIDATNLGNGRYTLQLIITDEDGQTTAEAITRTVEVTGEAKVGNFRFSETDLTIPVAGIPLTLSRSYDTLNAAKNSDFGYGWSYDLSMNIREAVTDSRVPMSLDMTDDGYFRKSQPHTLSIRSYNQPNAWAQRDIPGIGYVFSDPSRDVWITLPGGQKTRFKFYMDGSGQVRYAAPQGVYATLAPLGDSTITETNGIWHWSSLGLTYGDVYYKDADGSIQYGADQQAILAKYDIPGYVLSTPDGTKFTFEKEESPATENGGTRIYDTDNEPTDGLYSYIQHIYTGQPKLARIEDANGNAIQVDSSGLTQILPQGSNAIPMAITFDRENGRIIDARQGGATGKIMTRYAYTEQGDLDHVDRLVNTNAATEDEKWQTTYYHYKYVGTTSTHKIRSITSDSGKTPILNEYDPVTGRLKSTTDAKNNVIYYNHDLANRYEKVKDRNGQETTYGYDARGNVTYKRDPAGQVTTYAYDANSPEPDAETEVITALGTPLAQRTTHTRSYTDGLRTSEVTRSFGPDGSGGWVEVAPLQVTEYTYKEGKQVVTLSASSAGQATSSDYDPKGNLTLSGTYACTVNPTTGAVTLGQQFTKTTFDAYDRGNPQTVTQYQCIKDADNQDVWVPYTRSISVYNSQGVVTESRQEKPDGTILAATTYGVDTMGRVQSTTQHKPDAKGNWKDTDGKWLFNLTTSTLYDEQGKVTDTYTPDGQGGTLHTQTLYNDDGQVWRSIDARNNYTETEYDELGQVTATRQYDATGKLLSTTGTTYSADGKVATGTDALGNVTSSYDDLAGRSVRTLSPDGTSSETLYDAAGRAYLSIDTHVASQTTGLRGALTLYDPAGRARETRLLSGLTIILTDTDADNHLLQVTLALPTGVASAEDLPYLSHTQTFYNAKGQVWKSVDAAGTATWSLYDAAGRQTDTIQAVDVNQDSTVDATDTNGDGIPDTGSERLCTHTEYDGLGRAYQTTDAKGHTTTTVYNDRGQVDRTVYDDGSFVAYGYDAMGRKAWQSKQLAPRQADNTKPGYETPEQFQARIDASKTTYEYSDLGQLTAVVLPAVPDPENAGAMTHPRTEYTYDKFGNQETQKDAKGRVTTFHYDPLTGQQTARVLPLGQREETHYDDLGRTDWTRDLAGRTTVFGYDSLGRLQTKTFFTAGKDPAKDASDATVTYTYDSMGRTQDIIDSANGTTHYEYDAEGRQALVASPQGTIHYRYDDLGRLKRTFTSNTDTRYTFDELGRLETVTMTMRGGQAVAGSSLSWYGQTISGETTRYQYDQVGNLDLIQQSDGVVSDYSYDDLNRLTDLKHFVDTNGDAIQQAAEKTLAGFHYDLNADGNKASATETDDQNITRNFVWKYDANDRLISETLSSTDNQQNYITRYTMDLVGNRLKQETDNAATGGAIAAFAANGTLAVDEVTDSTFDANDRIQTERHDAMEDTKDTFTQYAWNAGDQTGKTVHAGLDAAGTVTEQTTFEYNVQSRTGKITVVKDGHTTVISYKYNPDGIRVEEATTEDGVTTTKSYLIDSSNFTGYAQVLEEFVNGQLAKTFTLGHDVVTQAMASTSVVPEELRGQVLTFLYDGHGSTRELLNAVAQVVQRYAYQAFGQNLDGQGLTSVANAITSLLYSGEMTDKSGRQNLRDRIMELMTGRFTQTDRRVNPVGDIVNANGQLYCNGNPIGGIDPSGQSMLEVMTAVLVAIVVWNLLVPAIGVAQRSTAQLWLYNRHYYGETPVPQATSGSSIARNKTVVIMGDTRSLARLNPIWGFTTPAMVTQHFLGWCAKARREGDIVDGYPDGLTKEQFRAIVLDPSVKRIYFFGHSQQDYGMPDIPGIFISPNSDADWVTPTDIFIWRQQQPYDASQQTLRVILRACNQGTPGNKHSWANGFGIPEQNVFGPNYNDSFFYGDPQ